MPEYLSPGVYIEEIEIGSRPIEGVSTSTAGMIGVTGKGPVDGLPVLTTSFEDYQRKFGGFLDEEKWGESRFLPFAVDGFFKNGGQRVYIKRVVGENAQESKKIFTNQAVTRLTEDMSEKETERTRAKLSSMRGVEVGTKIKFIEESFSPEEIIVTSYYNNEIRWETPLKHKFTREGTQVIAGEGVTKSVMKIKARSPGEWGDGISVKIEPASRVTSFLASTDTKETKLLTLEEELNLSFDPDGPEAGEVEVKLQSVEGIDTGSVVEFRRPGQSEKRYITGVDTANKIIRWDIPLENSYKGTESKAVLMKAGGISSLLFQNIRPEKGDRTIYLKDVSKLRTGNTLKFLNKGKLSEIKKISEINNDGVTLEEGLAYDYNLPGSMVFLVSYDPCELKLEFKEKGPTVGKDTTVLKDVSGLETGDTVELTKSGPEKETLKIKGIDYATRTITLERAVGFDYSVDNSSIRYIPSVVDRCNAESNITSIGSEGKNAVLGDILRLKEDDIIEFENQSGEKELRRIIDINTSSKEITVDTALKHHYNPSGCKITVKRAIKNVSSLKLKKLKQAGPSRGSSSMLLENVYDLAPGETVELENAGGQKERRRIKEVFPEKGEITFEKALLQDYSEEGSKVKFVTAIRSAPVLKFDGAGPSTGATWAQLADVSKLKNGDVVKFLNSSGQSEEHAIISVNTGEKKITWDGGLLHSYNEPASRVFLPLALLKIDKTEGFAAGDTVRIRNGESDEIASIHAVDVSNGKVTISFIRPSDSGRSYTGGDEFVSAAVYKDTDSIMLDSVNNFYIGALIELDNGFNKEYRRVDEIQRPTNRIKLDRKVEKAYFDGNIVKTREFNVTINYRPELGSPVTETYNLLTMNCNVTEYYFRDIITESSKLVKVEDLIRSDPEKCDGSFTDPFNQPYNESGLFEYLKDGNSGDIPKSKHYIGVDDGPEKRTGIQSFKDIDEISILAVPGITGNDYFDVHNELINHCEIQMKDRFAVLDAPRTEDISVVQRYRERFDTNYAAIYYPWVTARDPVSDKTAAIPPSGHILGIYARSDVERGVHKAPANEIVQGITGVDVQINKGEQDILNPKGINAIRVFKGRGTRVWGARTLSSNSLWKYVNVRRLFLFLEESIDEGTQFVVFEPNDPKLWARVIRTLTEFLTRVWRDGALMGSRPEEAFFIKADRTTMTQDDIDNGRLIVQVGVAPVKPAEFVIFRIAQFPGGTDIREF